MTEYVNGSKNKSYKNNAAALPKNSEFLALLPPALLTPHTKH